MNTFYRRFIFTAGVLFALLTISLPSNAAYLPDGQWYVFGDTVSLGFPRVAYTTIQHQITETEYTEQSCSNTWGVEGIYSKDDDGYFYYNYTVRDTITLVFSARPDASGNYSAVNGYLANTTGSNAILDDMWYVKDVTPEPESGNIADKYWPRTRVRMRVQHLASGKWLAYAPDAKGNLTLKLVNTEEESSPFAYEMDESDTNYHYYGDARMTSFMPVVIINGSEYYFESLAATENSSVSGTRANGNYIKTTRSMSYSFRLTNKIDLFMLCYQWSKENSRSYNITPTPASTTFDYAADAATAAEQAVEQSFGITMTDSCNLYCVHARQIGRSTNTIQLEKPKTVSDAAVLENTYGLTAKFYWASNGKGSYTNTLSPLETKQIDNTMSNVAPYNAETARNMMTYSAAHHDDIWKVTVTPDGRSPYNVIDTTLRYMGTTADYSDILYCDVIDGNGNILKTKGAQFVRKAYHVTTIADSLKVTVSPQSPIVAVAGGDLTFTYSPSIVNSTIRYTANGSVDEIIYQKDSVFTMEDAKLTVKLNDSDNKEITGDDAWVTIVNADYANNIITLHFQANGNINRRIAILVVSGIYKDIVHAQYTYIVQEANITTGDITFNHQEGGYTGWITNSRGIQYQKVHTYEKTIYYTSGETIELMPNEPNMRGYWRWYDYDSDTDPRYYWDGSIWQDAGNDFWQNAPKDQSGKTFTAINSSSASKGFYATKDSYTFPVDARDPDKKEEGSQTWSEMIPKIKGWDNETEHNIALDASAYADYTITSTSITEPTLSYRQIWHLRPAKIIADSLDKCTSADKPYESHEYIAPTDKEVYLATNFPHYQAQHHQSEFCYWFNAKTTTQSNRTTTSITGYKQTGNNSSYSDCVTPKWKVSYDGGGTWTDLTNNYESGTDYLQVNSATERIVEYALYIPKSFRYTSWSGRNQKTITVEPTCGSDIYIARFKVTYVSPDTYGPSTTALRTDEEIANSYTLLTKQDFNYGTAAGSLATDKMVFYPKPLAPDNSTFGFLYVDKDGNAQHNRQKPTGNSEGFPFYGEYCLVNQITDPYYWTRASQHGGAANGYMMYVDGKKQPGLAATISTDAVLCSGQQMYCYAWIYNAATENTLPVLRFDVQGRRNDNEEWTTVAAFFVGELPIGKNDPNNSTWQQVNFPVVSANDYAQTRISIYNFANSNSGNDFLVDDICLYASKLPLTAYQAFTTCKVKDMEVAVARIDYSNMTSSGSNQTLYYTFMNTKADTMLHAVYHYPENWSGTTTDKHGVIYVPKEGYDPTKSNSASYQESDGIPGIDESGMVYTSASEILESLEDIYLTDYESGTVKDGYTLKGYVKTTDKDGERYIMYIAHLINDTYMPSSATYTLNMANIEEDLKHPDCSMSANLPLSNKTNIAFDGSTDPTVGACANGLYPVVVRVNNTVEVNGNPVNLVGAAKADWLLGCKFDDVYIADPALEGSDEEKDAADNEFQKTYGYPRGKVQDALNELRRYTNTSNYTVSNPDEIIMDTTNAVTGKQDNILLEEHYNIIMNLCNKGLLSLYKDSDAFYMRQNDTIRFWVYPIAGTAKAKYNDTEYILDNCSNNTFLRGFTNASDYEANLSPVKLGNMTDEQRHSVPRVRVAACKANEAFKIPVSDISSKVVFGWDSCRVVSSTDPEVQALIDRNAGVDQFSMRYTQDRIMQDITMAKYYKAGDSITFTPIDAAHVTAMQNRQTTEGSTKGWTTGHPGFWHANTHKMRAGYEYTMQLTMLTESLNDKVDAGCPVGDVYFTIIVVPDTVVWTPLVSDYWGDDDNWYAIINGKTVQQGYVPLAETDVIIPTISDERKYPYLCDSIFYPMDAHYVPAKCHKIRFCGNTAILNQQVLQYDSAYADLTLTNGTWNLIASPLQGVYSGDFFVPHSGTYTNAANLESTDNFTVSDFRGTRSSNAGYAAWSRYYNDSVATEHYDESSKSFSESFNMFYENDGMFFAASNTLSKELKPAGGLELGIWGPDNLSDPDITIRLPKPDTKYDKYFNGAVVGQETIDRSKAHKFSFTPDKEGKMKVTLYNSVPSPYFIWGNPTMAYIDAEAFYYENADVLESYYWTLEDDKWISRTGKLVSYEDRFLKPFRAAMVYARGGEDLDSLTLTLSVKHLAISNIEGAHTNYAKKSSSPAPKRAMAAKGHYLNKGIMHISAFVRPEGEMTPVATAAFDLVAMDFANNKYDVSEDVPFFSVNIKDDGTTLTGASEMNIYSLLDTKKISVDIREQIGIVPLGFVISNDMRLQDNGKMTLHFTLTDWTEECYLIDSKTGRQTRIINGTELTLDMPANHEMRYYIQGTYKEYDNNDPTHDEPVIVVDKDNQVVSIFSYTQGQATIVATSDIAAVGIYDIAGRLVQQHTLNILTPVLTIPAPAGVALVTVHLADGTIVQKKVIVQ